MQIVLFLLHLICKVQNAFDLDQSKFFIRHKVWETYNIAIKVAFVVMSVEDLPFVQISEL